VTSMGDTSRGEGGRARPSRLPTFITDLRREPAAKDVPIAASLAIFAFGMDPRAMAPGMPTVHVVAAGYAVDRHEQPDGHSPLPR
jgi:hypothetical protein